MGPIAFPTGGDSGTQGLTQILRLVFRNSGISGRSKRSVESILLLMQRTGGTGSPTRPKPMEGKPKGLAHGKESEARMQNSRCASVEVCARMADMWFSINTLLDINVHLLACRRMAGQAMPRMADDRTGQATPALDEPLDLDFGKVQLEAG